MTQVRRTTATSVLVLGFLTGPVSAQQTIIFNDPAFQPQGQVFQPQQPFGNQPVYIDPNTGQPGIPPQPDFGQPLQQDFGQPLQQDFGQQPQFQPQQPSFGQQLPQPQVQPQQPSFGQQLPQPQAQPQQPSFGQQLPQPQAQPQQPSFGQQLPQPQQNFGSTLPQPGQAYTPQQSQNPNAPNDTAQQASPYYDRAIPEQPALANPPPTPAVALPEAAPNAPAPRIPTVNVPSQSTALPQPPEPNAPSAAPALPSVPGGDRGPQMSAELDALLAVGERYRAASPGFLEDLKALVEKYRDPLPQSAQPTSVALNGPEAPLEGSGEGDLASNETTPPQEQALAEPDPTQTDQTGLPPVGEVTEVVTSVPPLDPNSVSFAYFEDDFTDGDLTNNPPWRVRQGDWSVDPKYGLRAKAPEQVSDAPVRPKELLKVLLTGDAPQSEGSSAGPQAALIESQTPIGNAFSFAARIVDHAGTGTAHFIMHQGGANWLGYRLELRSGPQPVVVLTRRGSNGYKDITKVSVPSFTTGKQHELRWARLSSGQMIVLLNGRPIITSRDTVFREDWKGFAFFNAGGDVSIRAIRVSAPVER